MTTDLQGADLSTSRPVAEASDGGITISFSSHYGRRIEDYDYFPMGRKRNFANGAPRAVAALNVLLGDADFAYGLLSLRYDISLPPGDPDYVLAENFPQRLFALFNQTASLLIRGAVGAAYEAESVDIDTDHVGKNEELQFTNAHAKTILEWSYACMAAAPIVTTFMEERDIEAKEGVSLLMDCFGALLKRFEEPNTDILMKLRKLVESRVLQTRYSDKVMWNVLRSLAVDPYIYIDRLFRKFVTEGIPKLDQGTNVIKFFHAFLRYQLKFQFTAKFAMQYRPVRADVMDGEGMSAMEHLETELIRRDEGAAVLGEISCSIATRDASRLISRAPTEEEVEVWSHRLREHGINAWQRGMVTKFFLPYIGRVEAIRTRTLSEYAKMVLITKCWLAENDFEALADYISARVTEGADGRRLIARKRFVREFMDSAAFKELLGDCFGLASQSITDSNVVIDMISACHVNVFERLGGDPLQPASKVEHRIEKVAQEVVRFISWVARPPE